MVYLAVSIDVEPDCSLNWHYSNPIKFEGVQKGIKDILHPLFLKYNIAPTYLINNVVLEDDLSVETFSKLDGRFELGAHLHPEFIEPEKTIFEYSGAKGAENCCFYDPDIEYLKIENITKLFISKFGYSPKSFRAGRFSAGRNTIKSLKKLGYVVDSSVTPNIIWDDKYRKHPVSYLGTSNQPYFTNDITFPIVNDDSDFVEIPISIVKGTKTLIDQFIGFLHSKKIVLNFEKNIWFRPKYSTTKELKFVVKKLVNNSKDNDVYLNMMFHNVEILPSLSPYCINQSDCKRYLKQLEDIFKFCNSIGVQSETLSSLATGFKNKNGK